MTQQDLSGLILNAEFRLRQHPEHPHKSSIKASLKKWKEEREALRWEAILTKKKKGGSHE